MHFCSSSIHRILTFSIFVGATALFLASGHAEPYYGTSSSRLGSQRIVRTSVTRLSNGGTQYAWYSTTRVAPIGQTRTREEEANAPAPQIESNGPRPTVAGSRAIVRGGIAYAPTNAPESVKRAIWAVNNIRRKPYKWGGGHGSFSDSGYDCSGTVSYALHNAGALGSPMPSSGLTHYGESGRGKWVTVYARNGHTFAVIAGLRLDTTNLHNGADEGPRWRADFRSPSGFQARHPMGL